MNKLQRIEEMERQLAALKAEVEKEADTKRWEPEGGVYSVLSNGKVVNEASTENFKLFGTERKTREQAEKAAAAMRTHNRLLAYVAEFAPDYDPTNSRDKCLIRGGYPSYYDYWWCPDAKLTGVVYMPHFVAIELCRKLNSGEVVL